MAINLLRGVGPRRALAAVWLLARPVAGAPNAPRVSRVPLGSFAPEDAFSLGQAFCRLRRRDATAPPAMAAAEPTPDSPAPPTPPAPQEPFTPPPAPPDPLMEPPPLGVPTPPASAPSMSPLSMSPMSVISDGEQDLRDEVLNRLRRERLAVDYGLLRTDEEGNQVLSDRSDGQETEFGVRRRRGPRSPHGLAVDSGSTARDTPSGGDESGEESEEGYETVCSSPSW